MTTTAPPAPTADAHHGVPPIGSVPDLSDLTGMPDGPKPAADAFSISAWDGAGMDADVIARHRYSARELARRAGECQATGKWAARWHASRYAAVLSLLAGAEQVAPEEDRPWHAARLDAYTAAYGLRGWHRYADFRGKHSIQINLIRTHLDGEQGRYFTHAADRMHGPDRFWIVDRDSGRTAYRTVTAGIARQWIAVHEGGVER